MLYYWLTNPFVHPRICCFLSFLCMCLFINLCFVFSHVSLIYCLLISFCSFINCSLIDYSFFVCRIYSLFLAIYVYLLIYGLFSIHLSFYFCTHFVLFSHVSTHLFIYWSYIVCLKVSISVCLFFFVSFHCLLFIVHFLIHFSKTCLFIDYSFFIYGILSVTPFRFNRHNILTDYGIYLSESL